MRISEGMLREDAYRGNQRIGELRMLQSNDPTLSMPGVSRCAMSMR